MNSNQDARYKEYVSILAKNSVYKKAFAKTCKAYLDANGKPVEIDTGLYLMVFATTLIGFVDWVIEQAVQTGKNRLYFLSRDGYQMYLIAKRLIEIKKVQIKCEYLHVSRYSMRIPGYHLNIEKSIDSICVGGIDVTPLRILKRGGLTENESKKIIKELKIEKIQNKILNYHQVMKLKEKFRISENLKKYITNHSLEAYETAIGYLKQKGLCKDGKFAIVDSGWIGTLQCSIERLVKSVNSDIAVEGYYFGMYEYPKEANIEQFHSYYFSAKKGIKRKTCFSNSLFETIVSSTEGMTVGYAKDNGKYIPVFYEQKNPNEKQMKRNVEALKIYLQQLEIGEGICKTEINTQSIQEELLIRFMANPTMLEYECYGKNLFSDDVLDGNYKEVATPLTWEQIRNQRFLNKILIISGLKKATIYESAWLEGSTVRAAQNSNYVNKNKKEKILTSELRHIRFWKKCVFLRKQMKKK